MKTLMIAIFSGLFFCMGMASNGFAAGPIRVEKSVRDNPTIYFAGLSSNPQLSRELTSFLRACGWFDVVNRIDADYTLKGSVSGNLLSLELEMSGVPVGTWSLRLTGNDRVSAQIAVDALIERTFKQLQVKGFCTTKIAFCAETQKGIRNIYLCDIDGGNVQQLTNFRTLCVEPCWFPDGRSVGYSRYTKTGIDVVETALSPKRSRILTSLPGINTGAAISPDGRNLAVVLSPDHKVDLYVVPVGGRGFRRLTNSKAAESSPCWSPDGREIAFVSGENGRPRIHVIRADGSRRRILPSIGSEAVTPDWSGDGKIVYATLVDGNYTLAVYDTKTGRNERITKVPGKWESPAWAADNRQIVCKRSDGEKSTLYVVDSLTGKARLLVSTPYNLSMPVWSQGRKN